MPASFFPIQNKPLSLSCINVFAIHITPRRSFFETCKLNVCSCWVCNNVLLLLLLFLFCAFCSFGHSFSFQELKTSFSAPERFYQSCREVNSPIGFTEHSYSAIEFMELCKLRDFQFTYLCTQLLVVLQIPHKFSVSGETGKFLTASLPAVS